MLKKLFPGIVSAKSFAVPVPLAQAHDRVLSALTSHGYSAVEDSAEEITAQHGQVALFTYGTIASDITLVLIASPSEEYPVSVDVSFHDVDGGTQVSVNARYIKPVTFMGAPAFGPMNRKWHEACDAAVATVVESLAASHS
jgi:hypothetical protein